MDQTHGFRGCSQREEAEQARIAFEANKPRDTAQNPVVKGENVDQVPTGIPAPPPPSNRSQTGGSNDNASLPPPPKTKADVPPPPPAPQVNPEPEVDLTTLPVPILDEFAKAIEKSAYKTTREIALNVAQALSVAPFSRRIGAPTGTLLGQFLNIMAPQGIGKAVAGEAFNSLVRCVIASDKDVGEHFCMRFRYPSGNRHPPSTRILSTRQAASI